MHTSELMPGNRHVLIKVLRGLRVIPLLAAIDVAPAVAQPVRAPSIAPGSASIDGRLTDALTRQPLTGCMVSLNQLYVTPSRSAVATTDADGRYAFTGIADAEYHVNAMCDSHLPTCYRDAGSDSPRCDSVAVVVDQHKANVDLALTPGATARGRVIDQRGRPIASATVRLGMSVRDAPLPMHKPTTTNRDGAFELVDLPAGEWRLQVELPELPGSIPPPMLYFPGVLHVEEAGSIELIAGQALEGITFVAPSLADNALVVRVVALPQAFSQLEVSFVQVDPLMARRVPIDDAGTGSITGLVPGRYFLAATGLSGDRTWTAHDVVDFVGDTQELVLYMQPAARISGRVTAEKGATIPFDGVLVGAAWVQDGVEVNPLDIDEVPVAPDGSFSLDGLFGTRRLQVIGLDPPWEIRSITQDGTDVMQSGVALTADTEAKVVIVLGRR